MSKLPWTERAAQFVARNRRSWLIRKFGSAAYLFWRAYENRNFDMASNGEAWCLSQLSSLQPACVFDVGANIGDWSLACHRMNPKALIHSFEIAAPTFQKLRENTRQISNIIPNQFGLSDKEAEIEIYLPETADFRATMYSEHLTDAFEAPGAERSRVKKLKARVMRGDDYAKNKGVQLIDVLKIDVEGMEKSVILGFEEMFLAKRIRLVQFEYNTTNIVSGFLLREAYQIFERFGYRVGKLYPDHVSFRDYHYRLEDFCGPNMIAIRKDDEQLRKVLL